MEDKLLKIKKEALEEVSTKYLGRKHGLLNDILRDIKNLSIEEKKTVGPMANETKKIIEEAFASREKLLEGKAVEKAISEEWSDVTLPGKKNVRGHLHPNTQVQYELEDLFR